MNNQFVRLIWGTAVLIVAIAANPGSGWPQEGQSEFIQHFDQDRDGLVSLDEFPGNQEQFELLDINGDEYLDNAEAPRRPHRRPPEFKEILEKFDVDGDGLLSADEFPGPQDHFDLLDTDGDGYLSQAELAAGRPGPPEGNAFEQDDADQDGMVSRAEFSGPEDFFNHLDSDGDGYITREEARAANPPAGPPPGVSETGGRRQ